MKNIVFILLLCANLLLTHNTAQGQSSRSTTTSWEPSFEGSNLDFASWPELRRDFQDIANSVASKLLGCCSSYGGNDPRGDVIWSKCYYNKDRNIFTVTTVARWTGTVTGNEYWIKGRLKIASHWSPNNEHSLRRTWEKISDSGGFATGCGQTCNLN